ncbi:hypothetical protein TNCT_661521, partial [Trichonephila clavata]
SIGDATTNGSRKYKKIVQQRAAGAMFQHIDHTMPTISSKILIPVIEDI